MTKQEKTLPTIHREIIMAVLDEQALTDEVIVLARKLVPQLTPGDFVDRQKIEMAIGRCQELGAKHQKNDELTALAQSHFAIGICHLILDSGDDSLESFQICAEMSESQNERITQGWALAFHGLTKGALYELLKEDGRKDIDRAREMFDDEDHQLGINAIDERFRGMSN